MRWAGYKMRTASLRTGKGIIWGLTNYRVVDAVFSHTDNLRTKLADDEHAYLENGAS